MDDSELRTVQPLLEDRYVATAESCTGGLVASALARMEGSGDWFRGGVVAYEKSVKFDVLGVTRGPVVTERAAREMALGVAQLLGADVAVSVTGAAGPDSHDGAEPGTVVIGVLVDGMVRAETHHFRGEPASVCAQARDEAIRAITEALRGLKTLA